MITSDLTVFHISLMSVAIILFSFLALGVERWFYVWMARPIIKLQKEIKEPQGMMKKQ